MSIGLWRPIQYARHNIFIGIFNKIMRELCTSIQKHGGIALMLALKESKWCYHTMERQYFKWNWIHNEWRLIIFHFLFDRTLHEMLFPKSNWWLCVNERAWASHLCWFIHDIKYGLKCTTIRTFRTFVEFDLCLCNLLFRKHSFSFSLSLSSVFPLQTNTKIPLKSQPP